MRYVTHMEPNRRGYQLRALLLGLTAILLAVSMSGCIQTELGKALLFKEETKKEVYGVAPILTSLNHEFSDSRVATPFDDQENFEVKSGAKWITVTIEVTILVVYPTSLQHFIDTNELRFVNMFIVDPDGRVFAYEFASSTVFNLDPIVNPTPGLWKVTVNPQGRGVDDLNPLSDKTYNDGYSISGGINQPM
jgi:hypothetical protein